MLLNPFKCTAPILLLGFALIHADQVHTQPPPTQPPVVPTGQTAAAKLSFDVASIRLTKPDSLKPPNFPLDASDTFGSLDPQGRFTADFPLEVFIEFAYKLRLSREQRSSMLAPLPKWAGTDYFQVNAKAEGNPTKEQMRLMVQSLLADRFKLAIHFETQQVPVLALVLDKPGKTGPNLRPHAEGPPCNTVKPPVTGSSASATDIFPSACGLESVEATPNNTVLLSSRDTTMKRIADTLPDAGRLGRPVVDQTGLTGTFDYKLHWTPDSGAPAMQGTDAQPELQGTSFLEALKEQLGLKLKPTNAPLSVLIVDHVERPSEN